MMKKIYMLLILGCASLMLFSSIAVAGDYDYEGTDESGLTPFINTDNFDLFLGQG